MKKYGLIGIRYAIGPLRIFFLATLYAVSCPIVAEESLALVMARMVPHGVVAYRYQETRTMELLSEPWQGSGVLYANPPDQMVKLQVKPVRVVMVVNRDRMTYYDSARRVRHSALVRGNGDFSSLIITMRAIMNGDRARLEEDYRIEFMTLAGSWRLKLMPKSNPASVEQSFVLVTGPIGGIAGQMVMQQADGDRSVLKLIKTAENEGLVRAVNLLIEEAEGN